MVNCGRHGNIFYDDSKHGGKCEDCKRMANPFSDGRGFGGITGLSANDVLNPSGNSESNTQKLDWIIAKLKTIEDKVDKLKPTIVTTLSTNKRK